MADKQNEGNSRPSPDFFRFARPCGGEGRKDDRGKDAPHQTIADISRVLELDGSRDFTCAEVQCERLETLDSLLASSWQLSVLKGVGSVSSSMDGLRKWASRVEMTSL